ncbi:cell surface protein [Borreliella burgdorferi]|nr:Vsp/OspC family lipoprotein [Borreliella burgdorferi]MCD2331085.1 cell surface protein [Borreliella burgdorferi]MCD2408724.1 cell surface protein [Borreliella burgdorferi]PRR26024.1 cell surface protein [Borreliella burgdorferi]PRR30545.1 cell surface protein [Borreliella burgdorferi]
MKKNTLSAILMTLFLFISCNNSGKDGNTSANSADESVKGPNLVEISKKITDSNAVVIAVKEVETLLVSIDELAKAIGKKIEAGGTLGSDGAHNGSLLAGAYKIATEITANLSKLKASEDLKEKITKAKECSEKFTDKLKSENVALGKQDASDDDAKKAILKTHNDITKGAKELKELSESVETLLKAAKEMLANSVKELTSPVVAETPKKP